MAHRVEWDEYFLNIAEQVAKRGTCLRRNYGAVIVKNNVIVSTGYTGSPRGVANCSDTGNCLRDKLGIPSGELVLNFWKKLMLALQMRRRKF